jgi:hypothetical protein
MCLAGNGLACASSMNGPRLLTIVALSTGDAPMISLNVGNIDRAFRVLLGLTLIGLAVTGHVGVWGYVGVVPLLTGAVAWCPLYSLVGLRTTSR